MEYTKIMGGPLEGFYYTTTLNHLYIIGNYENESVEIILNNGNIDSSFVDVGANTGYISMIASKNYGEVYSFEPMRENTKDFRNHINVNKFTKIHLSESAVGNIDGTIDFTMSDNLAANTYVDSLNEFVLDVPKVTVPILKLDTFFKDTDHMPISFIKIDAEGAEFDVLSGSLNVIYKYKPFILLSTHDQFNPGVEKKCLNFLNELGYKIKLVHSYDSDVMLKEYFCHYF